MDPWHMPCLPPPRAGTGSMYDITYEQRPTIISNLDDMQLRTINTTSKIRSLSTTIQKRYKSLFNPCLRPLNIQNSGEQLQIHGSITCTTPNRVTEALLSPDIRFLFGDIVPSVGSACDVWG
ncbi:unnamed protein product [Brassica rapa]|uniref:Uncharacterized protein n=2 Tax=Brassica TaxID=3705 RepID=A0A8D9GWL1_BRACM|nr:unnamed protein product [Brassica napus]CAG7888152.1 unnamed protein product [Brassica rapa]